MPVKRLRGRNKLVVAASKILGVGVGRIDSKLQMDFQEKPWVE